MCVSFVEVLLEVVYVRSRVCFRLGFLCPGRRVGIAKKVRLKRRLPYLSGNSAIHGPCDLRGFSADHFLPIYG